MVLRSQVRRAAIVVETTEGTAITLTGSHYANNLVQDMALQTMAEIDARKPSRASYSSQVGPAGVRSYTENFAFDMKGDGTAGSSPPFSTFLAACCMAESNVAAATVNTVIAADDNSDDDGLTVASGGTFTGTYVSAIVVKITTGGALDGTAKCSVTDLFSYDTDQTDAGITSGAAITTALGTTITFTSTGTMTVGDRWLIVSVPASCKKYIPTTSLTTNSYTIGDSFDGMRHVIAGARGNAEFVFEAGKPGLLNLSYQGTYAAPTTTAMPTVTDINTQIPPAFLAGKVSIDGYEATAQRLSFNLGNVLTPDISVNSSTGVLSVPITDRNITGSITLRRTTTTTNDFWGDLMGGAPLWISAQLGSTKGNMFQFVACIQYTGMNEQDDGGIASLEVPFNVVACDNTKETEFQLYAL